MIFTKSASIISQGSGTTEKTTISQENSSTTEQTCCNTQSSGAHNSLHLGEFFFRSLSFFTIVAAVFGLLCAVIVLLTCLIVIPLVVLYCNKAKKSTGNYNIISVRDSHYFVVETTHFI